MQQEGVYYVVSAMVSFNTASGRYCCNTGAMFYALTPVAPVSIPQAVGTVATTLTVHILAVKHKKVSIPQAVGTVATN